MRENRNVPRRIFLQRLDARMEIETMRAQIERNTALIESTERGLLHENVLRHFMSVEHYEDLISRGWPEDQADHLGLFAGSKSVHGNSVLPVWLDIVDVINVDVRTGNDAVPGDAENPVPNGAEPNPHQAQVPDDADDDDEDNDDDDDGAHAEEDERRLEVADEDDEAVQRRLQEQERLRRNVERADEQLAVNLDNLMNDAGQRGEGPAAGNDGLMWEQQRDSRKKRKQRLRRRLRMFDKMTDDDVELITDVWALPVDDRWKLYRYWVSRYVEDVRENILDAERTYQIAADRYKEVLEEEDMAVMSRMKVIGMTTTGAARYINSLRRIKPKVVVVEEAAEVLEAHTVAPLSEGCEHLILIGDHQQLRPSPQVYDLAENYNLKYSLFERLVMNDLDHETLNSQHRMRPEIADVMRLFYKELTDDESVKNYPNVKGIMKNVYFINHSFEEQRDDELKSVSNEHEARFVIALGNYLVQQGYSTSQITILTPYMGQVFVIRRLMKERPIMNGVHVCPIDNFQGEENDIVLLSLVRSNEHKKIGFLKEENRICVALSRAKIGFYAIGDFQMLTRCSERWSKIIAKAREMGISGQSLRLSCQNHPDVSRIEARTAADFNSAPEGGCMRQCDYRLECGHACERVCHPYDRDHSKYDCMKPCQKILCNRGHKCRRTCNKKCGQCMEV
jgi:hypothetical protein